MQETQLQGLVFKKDKLTEQEISDLSYFLYQNAKDFTKNQNIVGNVKPSNIAYKIADSIQDELQEKTLKLINDYLPTDLQIRKSKNNKELGHKAGENALGYKVIDILKRGENNNDKIFIKALQSYKQQYNNIPNNIDDIYSTILSTKFNTIYKKSLEIVLMS